MEFTVPVLYSKEMEINLLGSILINPQVMEEIEDLRGDEFGLDIHKVIFASFRNLWDKRQPIDIGTVIDELTRMGSLDEIGGIAYLMTLINNVSISMNADEYARRIVDYARRRKIQMMASEFAKAAYNFDSDIEDSVALLVDEVTKDVTAGAGLVHWSEFAQASYRTAMKNKERFIESGGKDIIDGIPTGILDFDMIIGGLHKKEVVLIAGEPGVGKSVFGNQALFYIARIPDHYTALFSLEMPGEQVSTRLLSVSSNVSVRKLRRGDISDDEDMRLIQAVEGSVDIPFFIDETPSISMAQIKVKAHRLKNKMRGKTFGALMIDYSLLVNAQGKDETDRSAYVSGEAKKMAKQLGIPVVLIASVTKAGMDGGDIGKANVRGSGQQQHDVDTSIAIMNHIPPKGEKADPNLATCIITKARESLSNRRVFDVQRGDGVPVFTSLSAYDNVSSKSDDDDEVF